MNNDQRRTSALNWRRIGLAVNDRVQAISDFQRAEVCRRINAGTNKQGAGIWIRVLARTQGRVRRATAQLRG